MTTDSETHVDFASLGRIGPAMVVLVLAVIASFVVPGLEFARPWSPGDPLPYWNLLGRYTQDNVVDAETNQRHLAVDAIARDALASDPAPAVLPDRPIRKLDSGDKLPAYTPHPDDRKPVVTAVELFDGHELDAFFASLARSDAALEGAITRVVHYGDSVIGIDGITSAIRVRMQARFGDAGHGFHLMAPSNTSYQHEGVRFRHNGKWGMCFIIKKCRGDGRYGLGGTTFRSTGGAETWLAPREQRSAGRVSRFELWYAGQPGGGRLRLRVDGGDPVVIETAAETLEDRWYPIDVEDGVHELSVRAAGGKVRTYGVTLERDVPGVVWDGMSQVGAWTKRMGGFDAAHLSTQLNHRRADLVVFMFGGNDMIRKSLKMEDYVAEYRQVVSLFRQARPGMACLIMSPLDHGVRQGKRIVSRPVVPKMVEAQRATARAEGCAFYDTYSAMGGEGSAGRWFRQSPRLISGDLGHATHKGHIAVGEMFYRALVQAYANYRTARP